MHLTQWNTGQDTALSTPAPEQPQAPKFLVLYSMLEAEGIASANMPYEYLLAKIIIISTMHKIASLFCSQLLADIGVLVALASC